MNQAAEHRFSGPITVFHGRRLPEAATPAGYAALVDAFDLATPMSRTLTAIGAHHRIIEDRGWRLLTPRHAPQATIEGHLTFALKHEGLDLAVLKRLFLTVGPSPIKAVIRSETDRALRPPHLVSLRMANGAPARYRRLDRRRLCAGG